ncbi:fumarylacetoacetate hydrolase family protein [Marinomonas sp. IMCC 4694]|uniref:fumarylacetoacetate hydrolase family protein n=1 Tax=Marinomonas sp. IMCC 4694 TaxID=2605432 RepID=UPI0011E861D4|nr:fumarylacetoacetate hydrolase family protein [Marinomonas sp. IMCC 4694]TYL48655.1 fumarylacetoacetate hydrolase family protein [Marinomonas sp. IMCC 4694]
MKNIVSEQARVYLPVVDSDQVFPVGRVYCVGRNYAEHAREMGDDPDRDPPFFFAKDASCVVPAALSQTTNIAYPMASTQFEYEVELVVALGKGGKNLTLEQAAEAVLGYAVGLDMTRRDLQGQAKKKGRPWEVGKSFDESAPVGPVFLKTDTLTKHLADANIGLKVNDELKQKSRISNLTWSIEEVICKLSDVFELRAGDLIMTGTPENVGPVLVGDEMLAWVEHLGDIRIKVTD